MRVTTPWWLDDNEVACIAGDEVATDGNWVSVFIDCHVDFDTPADIDQPGTKLNLVLAGSTVVPLIATLAMASRDTELLDSLAERWQIPVPGRHSGPRAQASLVRGVLAVTGVRLRDFPLYKWDPSNAAASLLAACDTPVTQKVRASLQTSASYSWPEAD